MTTIYEKEKRQAFITATGGAPLHGKWQRVAMPSQER